MQTHTKIIDPKFLLLPSDDRVSIDGDGSPDYLVISIICIKPSKAFKTDLHQQWYLGIHFLLQTQEIR
jgi:hypothetical protein